MRKRSKLRKFLWILSFIAVALAAWFAWSAFQTPVRRSARNFPDPAPRHELGRVLVVYYSLGGNTGEVARRIRDMTDGTLLEIETRDSSFPAKCNYVGI